MRPRTRWIAFGIVLLGLLLSYRFLDPERLELTDASLAQLRSPDLRSRIQLPDGSVHYELTGPPSAPLVVLVHGVSGPMTVWDRILPALQQAGFRVLRFDLYGRGFSDRPDTRYDLDLYVRELEGLLDALGLREPFRLVGHSMGCIVSTEYILRHPERVTRLALVSPAGFPLRSSPLAAMVRFPVIGEYVMAVAGDATLMEHNRKYFFDAAPFGDFLERFHRQLRFHGSKRAILSTYRAVPLQDYLPGFAKLGATRREVLAFWGTHDVSFPYSNHLSFLEAVPTARLVTIENAAHLPQYERPDEVSGPLLKFLAER